MGPATATAKPDMPAEGAEGAAEGGAAADGGAAPPAMGMGMMGGMGGFGGMGGGRGGRGGAAPEVKYEATAWGRYIKVLLSASEFVFIN